MKAEFGSAQYWQQRYRAGGNSGSGSFGNLGQYKAAFVNNLVRMLGISSVADIGCGDGNQISLLEIENYTGFDVSGQVVESCRTKFKHKPGWKFETLSEQSLIEPRKLSLSLDVIYHLVEDSVFDDYLNRLFDASDGYVLIYSSNHTGRGREHVRHRRYLDWVRGNRGEWKTVAFWENPYSLENQDRAAASEKSFAFFTLFAKEGHLPAQRVRRKLAASGFDAFHTRLLDQQRRDVPLPHIGTLWIGDRLSFIEQMSLRSMLQQGHQVTLFSYQDITGVPHGVHQADARDICTAERLVYHEISKSPAPHADLFRLRMIRETGFLWVDLDVILTRPLRFSNSFVFGYENPTTVCNAVLGLPQDCATLPIALDQIEKQIGTGTEAAQSVDHARSGIELRGMKFADFGPVVLTNCLRKTGEISHALPQDVFFPLGYAEVNRFFEPNFDIYQHFSDQTRAVHLWGRKFRKWASNPRNVKQRFTYFRSLLNEYGINLKDIDAESAHASFARLHEGEN